MTNQQKATALKQFRSPTSVSTTTLFSSRIALVMATALLLAGLGGVQACWSQMEHDDVSDIALTDISPTQVRLTWTAVPDAPCEYSITYSIFRSKAENFEPSSSNMIASGLSKPTFLAHQALNADDYYHVRAVHHALRCTPSAGKPPTGKPGIVDGRVLLITEGGDLKIGRLINIRFLYYSGKTMGEYEHSAGKLWMDAYLAHADDYLADLKAHGLDWSDTLRCLRQQQSYLQALSDVIGELGEEQAWQIVTDKTDENGEFDMSVPPGDYFVMALGKAGFNSAVWTAHVSVKSGQKTTIKLTTPEQSCLVMP